MEKFLCKFLISSFCWVSEPKIKQNINYMFSLSISILKDRPIFSKEKSTGECRAVTWRQRQDIPDWSQRTGCSAPRCSQTLQIQKPRVQIRGSTCTATQTMQRMDTRCAPAPLTPPPLWGSAYPHLQFGCCLLFGRSYWPAMLNCYDAEARGWVLGLSERETN